MRLICSAITRDEDEAKWLLDQLSDLEIKPEVYGGMVVVDFRDDRPGTMLKLRDIFDQCFDHEIKFHA